MYVILLNAVLTSREPTPDLPAEMCVWCGFILGTSHMNYGIYFYIHNCNIHIQFIYIIRRHIVCDIGGISASESGNIFVSAFCHSDSSTLSTPPIAHDLVLHSSVMTP